jgi:hypothetical protein
MNLRLRIANYCADHTVYVGTWLQKLDLTFKYPGKSSSVILNGADSNIFNSMGCNKWAANQPLKIVTHHWSGNWMKGFDVYQRIDKLLEKTFWKDKIEFTYIGNLPNNFKFKNANYIKPLSGRDLADELRKHHVYITGSINEPGGNHQIEGALCGLPLLYINSGCMPEYCNGYGVMFEEQFIESAIDEIIMRYEKIYPRLAGYPFSAQRTNEKWLELLINLSKAREALISLREKKDSIPYNLINFLTL